MNGIGPDTGNRLSKRDIWPNIQQATPEFQSDIRPAWYPSKILSGAYPGKKNRFKKMLNNIFNALKLGKMGFDLDKVKKQP